ncbi:two-component regulator propeller domain-containing protein [Luteolibacter sp. LG18]|uniref:sensor histidine kinase n=1 Tax=Luteolibacter sp. LG18 TaxID=2819286 RepID=UPI0030C6BC25
MPSNVVSGVAQDHDGFIWAATGAGVTRFDGVRFEVIGTAADLPDTHIHCILVDRAGRVWVGSRRGVAYRENGVWKIPANSPNETVYALGETTDGTIWAGCFRTCLTIRSGIASKVDLGVEPDVRCLLPDDAGGMWILTRNHLHHRTAGNNGTELTGPWSGRDLTGLTKDAQNRLILCGSGVLFRQNGTDWENLNSLIPGSEANSNLACAVDHEGTLWIATRNRGVTFLHGTEHGRIDASGQLSLDDVRGLLVDREGNVWAGTNGGGLNRLRRRVFDTYGVTEGLGRTVTSAITVDPMGKVLVGTDGAGIFRHQDGGFVPDLRETGLPEREPIWSMLHDSRGTLWIGTFRAGLYRVTNGKAEAVPAFLDDPASEICTIQECQDGSLVLGLYGNGMRRLKDGHVERITIKPELDHATVLSTLEDHRGRLWVAAGPAGLWLRENGTWRDLRTVPGASDLQPTILASTPDGDIWAGTLGQGLIRWHDDKPTRWTEADGLISPTICQIESDDHGFLWLGSDRGLQRIPVVELVNPPGGPSGGRIHGIRFSRPDGLPTPQFSGEHGNLSTKGPDGALWFSLAAGAIRVNPAENLQASEPPVVHIESATTDKGPLWQTDLPSTRNRIVKEPGTGTLQIRFTSPSYNRPEETRFRYRMDGLEEEWQDTDGNRLASYASLPPGTYRFDVIASTPDGRWSASPASVTLEVKPYLWQTLGFRIVVGTLVLAALAILVRKWSVRRLKRRMARLLEESRLERERTRIARDLHDDLGASLSEINFLGTLAADTLGEHPVRPRVEGMVDRAQRMAKSLDEIVWTVNPANDSLSSTANYLCSRSQESLRTAGIRCRQDVADHLPNISFDSQLRHHLLMAVNEAVHNVLKHSRATECTLTIRLDGPDLLVQVADNGKGFCPEDVPPNRNGLTNLARRMESSKGSVEITSHPGQGTVVTLRTPVAPAA